MPRLPRQNPSPDTAGHRLIFSPFASPRPMLASSWASPCQSTASKAQSPAKPQAILRLRGPCEKERLAKAAPGVRFSGRKGATLRSRPWPRRGPHCGPCLGPLMVYSFIGGSVSGSPGGARILAPAIFFSTSLRVPVWRSPPSLSFRPELMARLPLERRAQEPVICAGPRGRSWPAPQTCRRPN